MSGSVCLYGRGRERRIGRGGLKERCTGYRRSRRGRRRRRRVEWSEMEERRDREREIQVFCHCPHEWSAEKL